MTRSPLRKRIRLARLIGAPALAAALIAGGLVLGAAPAAAAGTVTVDPDEVPIGGGEVAVSGTGFQSIPGGMGGIYVLFGWVDAAQAWQPSAGGTTGLTYRYQPDDEANPGGFSAFVTFPGGATETEAQSIMAEDGSWQATLKIRGAQFASFDREGNEVQVDCLAVQCGVITIGAHGIKNANNETFTPVTFVEEAATPTPTATASEEPSEEPTAVATEEPADEIDVAPVSQEGIPVWAWILTGVVVLAAVVVIVVLVLRRGRSGGRTPPPAS